MKKQLLTGEIAALEKQQRAKQSAADELDARAKDAERHNLDLEVERRENEKNLSALTKGEGGKFRLKSPEEWAASVEVYEKQNQIFLGHLEQYKSDFTEQLKGAAKDTYESMVGEAEKAFAVNSADIQRLKRRLWPFRACTTRFRRRSTR